MWVIVENVLLLLFLLRSGRRLFEEKISPEMLAYVGFETGTLGMRSAGTDRSATIGTAVGGCSQVLMCLVFDGGQGWELKMFWSW